jgi:hypothetical protein
MKMASPRWKLTLPCDEPAVEPDTPLEHRMRQIGKQYPSLHDSVPPRTWQWQR